MTNKKDYIGEVYNNLKVIDEVEYVMSRGGQKNRRVLCECKNILPNGKECGTKKIIRVNDLKRTLSCGCIYKATRGLISLKHGHRSKGDREKTKEYRTYCNMKQRCLNPNSESYEDYGGRGITICPEWVSSFSTFYKDMGDAPGAEYSIERVNNDGDYEPSNCIWATDTTQSRNSRNTKLSPCLVSFIRRNKHKYTVSDLAVKFNVSKNTIRDVVKYKSWSDIPSIEPWKLATKFSELMKIYS